MNAVLTTLLAVTTWAVASYGLGSLLFDTIVPPDSEKTESERHLIGVALGLLILSFVAYGLGRAGLYSRPVLIAVMGLGAVAGTVKISTAWGKLKAAWRVAVSVLRRHWWVTVPTGLLLVLALMDAALPCREYDTWRYHFSLPELWLREGVIADTGSTVYDGFDHAAEVLYGIGMALFGEEGANSLAWLMLALCPLALISISRELDWGAAPGLYGACILLAIHRVIRQPGEGWVDIFVLLFGLVATLLIARSLRHPENSVLGVMITAGLMLGMAASVKKTGLVLAASLLFVYALHSCEHIGWRRGLRRSLAAAVPFLALTSVWLAWCYSLTGNPFYPALNSVFGARGHGMGWASEAAARGFSRTIPNYLTYLWHLSFDFSLLRDTWEYGIGPGFVAFIPFSLLYYRRDLGVRMLTWFGVFYFTVFFFLAPQLVRYLMPGLGLLAVIAGFGAWRLQGLLAPRSRLQSMIPLLLVIPLLVSAVVEFRRLGTDLNLEYLSGQMTEEQYLGLHPETAEFNAIQHANRTTHGNVKFLLIGALPYRLEGERVTLRRLVRMELASENLQEHEWLSELQRRRISHVLHRHSPRPLLIEHLRKHRPKRETENWLVYDFDVFGGLDPRLAEQYLRTIRDHEIFNPPSGIQLTLEGYRVKREWMNASASKVPMADSLREVATVETPLPVTLYEVVY